MPILFKLVAVCSHCPERCEYEAEVIHVRGPYAEGHLLMPRDVVHEMTLPDGWSWKHRPFEPSESLCVDCTAEDQRQYELRAHPGMKDA